MDKDRGPFFTNPFVARAARWGLVAWSLIGILIRNSVILIVQIEHLRDEGRPPWEAVMEATEHRMRPIMLTAAAASLALIPIAREVFWGPMAYAMMGGIIVGTVLTLLFLPALYVAWFRIKTPENSAAADAAPLTCASPSTAIGANHGHVMMVSMADVNAAANKTYNIMGTALHDHTVMVTAALAWISKPSQPLPLPARRKPSSIHGR